jgi:hypothetical protein
MQAAGEIHENILQGCNSALHAHRFFYLLPWIPPSGPKNRSEPPKSIFI